MSSDRIDFAFDSPPDSVVKAQEEDGEGVPVEVACPACRGGKKCSVMGSPDIDCPLCKGEGFIDLNELLELIVEALCRHERTLEAF